MADDFADRLNQLMQDTGVADANAPPVVAPVFGRQPGRTPDRPPENDMAPAAPPVNLDTLDTITSPHRSPADELDRLMRLNDPDRPNAFTAGAQRSWANFRANVFDTENMQLGPRFQALFSNDENAAQLMGAAGQIEQSAPQSVMPDLRDIGNWHDFTLWLAERLGEQTVNIGSSMVGGLLGNTLGKVVGSRFMTSSSTAVLERLRELGSVFGAGVPNVMQETGGTLEELYNIPDANGQPTQQMHRGPALLAGGIKGVLESLTPLALSRMIGVIPGATAINTNTLLRTALKTGALEFGTEVSQEAVDMLARAYVDPRYDPFNAEGGWRLLNAGAAGFATGGTMGGAAHAVSRGRGPAEYSQTLPPGMVDALVAAARKTSPNLNTPEGPVAPLSPIEQATAAVQQQLEAERTQREPSPVPRMYRNVLGLRETVEGRTNLLSDQNGADPVTSGPVLAGEVAQQRGLLRRQLENRTQNIASELRMPRYFVIDKRTGQPVSAGVALSPNETQEAMALVHTQNAELYQVDYGQLDDRAITASVMDLPGFGDSRIHFVEGATPEQQAIAAQAYQRIQRVPPGTSRYDAQYEAIIQRNAENYKVALNNGLRVLPSLNRSFEYLGTLPVVRHEGAPQAATRSETAHVAVTDTIFTHPMQSYKEGEFALDTSAHPDSVRELSPLYARVEQGSLSEVTATMPTRRGLAAEDTVRGSAEWYAATAMPKRLPIVTTHENVKAGDNASKLQFFAAWQRQKKQYVAFTREIMRQFNLPYNVILMFGQADGAQIHLGQTGNFRIELYSPGTYDGLLDLGLSPDQIMFSVLKHELGHFITLSHFLELPTGLKDQLYSAWQQSRLYVAMGQDENMVTTSMALPAADERLYLMSEAAATTGYHLSFAEWLAEQTRRWMDTDEQVLTTQNLMFRQNAAHLKKLQELADKAFGEAGQRLYLPAKPITWWMEYIRRTALGQKVDETALIRYQFGSSRNEPERGQLNDTQLFPGLVGRRLEAAVQQAIDEVVARIPQAVKIVEDNRRLQQGELGIYSEAEKLIILANSAYALQNRLRTLRHEEVHALRHLFTEQEWAVLTSTAAAYFKDKGLQPGHAPGAIEARYRRDYRQQLKELYPDMSADRREAMIADLIAEEQVAYMLEARVKGHSFGDRLNDLLDRIIDFLRRVVNALRGQGFHSVRSIVHDIEAGVISERERLAQTQAEVDRVLREDALAERVMPTDLPGLHVKASDMQSLAQRVIDAWHGTPHVFPSEVEITGQNGNKVYYDLETPLPKNVVDGLVAGTLQVTPHPYGRFKLQKINTGEGAQVYGWGLYFTETEGIARHYRKTLANTRHQLKPLNEIEWEKLPGGLKAKPIWEAVFQQSIDDAKENGTEPSLDTLLSHMHYGAFMSMGSRGIMSDYFGYEERVRKVLETSPTFQQAMQHYNTVERPKYEAAVAEFNAKKTRVKYGTPEYNSLWRQSYTLALAEDQKRDNIYRIGLQEFGFSGESSTGEMADQVQAVAATHTDKGALYRVKINAKPDELLLYDEPFSKQPPKVQQVIRALLQTSVDVMDNGEVRLFGNIQATIVPVGTGFELRATYDPQGRRVEGGVLLGRFASRPALQRELTTLTINHYLKTQDVKTEGIIDRFLRGRNSSDVAADVRFAGIRGIKYLDGASRNKGKGTYNYVIFDESVVQIVERNGTPVSPEVEKQVLDSLKLRLERRMFNNYRRRRFGDVRDEHKYSPHAIARVSLDTYAALELTAGRGTLEKPDLITARFFQAPGLPLTGDVKEQLGQLGSYLGSIILERRPDGYETQMVRVTPAFRGRQRAREWQEYLGQRYQFTPKPSGTLLDAGYKMWLKRDPEAVRYYQNDGEGMWLSPTFLQQNVSRLAANTRHYYSPTAERQLQKYEALLAKVPKEAYDPAQLVRHYQVDPRVELANQVASDMMEAERRDGEKELIASTPGLQGTVVRQRHPALRALYDQELADPQAETAPGLMLRQIGRRLFNDPSTSAEQRNVRGYLTGPVAQTADRMTKVSKQWWGLKQLVQMNPNIYTLGEYDITIDQWNTDRMRWVADGDEIMRSWRQLPLAEQERLGQLLFYMTEMNYRTRAEVANGVVRQPTAGETAQAFRTYRIGAEGQQVFANVNQIFSDFLTRLETVMTQELNVSYTPGTPEHATALANLQSDFAGMRSRPYFPFMRHGRHTLTLRDPTTRQVLWFSTYENVSERDGDVGQVAARHPGAEVTISLLPEDVAQFQGMPATLLRHISANMPGLSPQQQEWLSQMQYDLSPSQSFRRRMMTRVGTPGYSLNAQRSFSHYFMYGGTHLARVTHTRRLQELVDQTRESAQHTSNNPRRMMIAEYMSEHLQYIMDGTRDSFKLKSFVTLYHLGFSPAAALMNLTQTGMFTLPMLGSLFGDARATSALGRAVAQRKMRKGQPGPRTNANFMRVRQELVDQGYISIGLASELAGYSTGRNVLTGMVGDEPQRFWREFTFRAMQMFQIAETFNREVTAAATWDLALADPQNPWMQRIHGRYAQEILALQQRLNITIPEAAAFFAIKQVIDSSQFNYADYARPPILRGKKAAILVPFFAYTQGALFAMRHNPGALKTALMLLFLAGLMGLPGAGDLDELIKLLSRRIFGKDFSIEDFVRRRVTELVKGTPWDKYGPDLAIHGASRFGLGGAFIPDGWGAPALRMLSGFDMSPNLGMGRLVPGLSETLKAAATGNPLNTVLGQGSQAAGGATFGAFYNMLQLMYSNPFSATAREWERAMPRALRGAMRSYRYATTGREETRTGATLVNFDFNDPVDMGAVIAQAIGFTPTAVGQKWEQVMARNELEQWYNFRRQWLYEQYDRAFRLQDSAGTQAVLADVMEFNGELARDGYGGLSITTQQLRAAIQNRARARILFENNLSRRRGAIGLGQDVNSMYPQTFEQKRVP